jgi:hypothetical protein
LINSTESIENIVNKQHANINSNDSNNSIGNLAYKTRSQSKVKESVSLKSNFLRNSTQRPEITLRANFDNLNSNSIGNSTDRFHPLRRSDGFSKSLNLNFNGINDK